MKMKANNQTSRKQALNTPNLCEIWDEKYRNRGNDEKVFSGNVDEYQFKYIESSHFIIVKNSSRTTKKVNHIQNSGRVSKQSHQNKQVVLQFKEQDFNFAKIFKQQVLNYFNSQMNFFTVSQTSWKKVNLNENNLFLQTEANIIENTEVHAIIINKVPICRYHCLFVPWIYGKNVMKEGPIQKQKLPQKITLQSLPLVLNLLSLYDDLVIGLNSVGSAASVNHLHFHMFFKSFWIGNQEIPLFRLLEIYNSTHNKILNKGNLRIQVFESEIIDGFMIEINDDLTETDYKLMYSILDLLMVRNIPHNLLFLRQGQVRKMVIFPRKFEQNEGVKFGCMEFSGVFCLDYENTTHNWIEEKFKQIKLQKQQFEDILKSVQKTIHHISSADS